jgi:hypothetical protein
VLLERVQPPEAGAYRDTGRAAGAREGGALVRELSAKEIEKNVPCRVSEQVRGNVIGAFSTRIDQPPYSLEKNVRLIWL